jgi:polyphenol oxidase
MSDDRLPDAPGIREADVVRDESLLRLSGIRHAFFTRAGGASGGIYASLNAGIGSKDDAEAVAANRQRMTRYLGVAEADIATPWQVHSAEAIVADAPFAGERPKVDGVVTRRRGLAVGVVTADCGPVLFADPKAGVVGAAHAGWRGATGGVLEATLDAMQRCGAHRSDVVAVLGPTITQGNYEVDAAMADGIVGDDPDAARFFAPGRSADKRQFDLPGLILQRLERAGVASATFVGRCTYGEEECFFSYRRTTHRREPDYGRQLAAIVLA